MISQIALVTILADDVPALVKFYREVLGFQVKVDLGQYVEFESRGVRFSICTRQTMLDATGHPSYQAPHTGQAFELAFPCETAEAVDEAYAAALEKGALPVKAPENMPWGQRTAFFADPENNIHEFFCDLPK